MTVYESKKSSTSESVYVNLKQKIINMALKPGEKISEKEIARHLNVSRTPVREAFLQLAREDLVEVYPQIGTVISKIDLDHVEETRFIREKIEVALVKKACREFSFSYFYRMEMNLNMQEFCVKNTDHTELFKLDEEFHKLLFYGCGMEWSWKMIQQMNNHFNRVRVLRLFTSLDWEIIVSQHKQLYSLIKNKEAEKAVNMMKNHLRLIVIEKETITNEYPDYFK